MKLKVPLPALAMLLASGALPVFASVDEAPPASAAPAPAKEGAAPKAKAASDDEGPPQVEARRAIFAMDHKEYVPGLYEAIMLDDADLVHSFLKAGASANATTPDGDTALCLALRNGRADIAITLLLHGADPNAPGLGMHTPIALASLRRHPTLLQMMLEAGGDPNKPFGFPVSKQVMDMVPDAYLRTVMKTEKKVTPLMVASARGDVEAVTLLLENGANRFSATSPHYRYALNFAAERRYLYVMRLLLGRKPESEPHIHITINLKAQKARLEVEGKLMLETKISTGRRGYDTPAGRYVITNKYKDWISTIYKVPMPYFMRLNCSAIGLHSGYVTGRPASHGCIRLPYEMAKKFFSMTNVGDEVTIEHDSPPVIPPVGSAAATATAASEPASAAGARTGGRKDTVPAAGTVGAQ